MQALIAEFSEESNEIIRSIWSQVETSCGEKSKLSFIYPHFTWQAAERYQVQEFEMILRNAFLGQRPFKIKLAGIGIFTGEKPVVYLNMVKTPFISKIHGVITDVSQAYITSLESYWLPENWMPHLTLMEPGTDLKTISEFLPCILERKFNKEIEVKSICLHTDEYGEWRRLFTIDLF
jgi:2'-5' RNA ligase